MKVFVVVLSCVMAALSEPPVPSARYLPSNRYLPSKEYLPSSQAFGSYSSSGSQQMNYQVPSNAYLPASYSGSRQLHQDEHISEPANYNFQYDVQDGDHGNDFGHEEVRHEDNTQGKYSVLLPDGRKQIVEYTADINGFKPKISYEQTGNGYGRTFGGHNGYSYNNGNGHFNNNGYNNNGYNNNGYNTEVHSNGGYQY